MKPGTQLPEQSSERAQIPGEILEPARRRMGIMRSAVQMIGNATYSQRSRQAEYDRIQGSVSNIVDSAMTPEAPKNPLFDAPSTQVGDVSRIAQSREDIAAIFAETDRLGGEAND